MRAGENSGRFLCNVARSSGPPAPPTNFMNRSSFLKKTCTGHPNRKKTKQSLALARIIQKRQTGEDLGILPQEERALKSPVEDQIEPVCNFQFHPLPIVL